MDMFPKNEQTLTKANNELIDDIFAICNGFEKLIEKNREPIR